MTVATPGKRFQCEVVCEASSPERANEDTYLIWQTATQLIVAVFDGVTQLLDYPSRALFARSEGAVVTSARFAAQCARSAIMQELIERPQAPLRDLLLRANDAIAAAVRAIYGEVSTQAIVAREPQLESLAFDPRTIRVLLPATVVTLVRIDLEAGRLTCGHLGDTALLLLRDTATTHVTRFERNGPFGTDSLYQQLAVAPFHAADFHPSLAGIDLEILRRDSAGRIFHNYVSAAGQIESNIGIGVLDGLPEMADYLREYEMPLAGVRGVLVCSDGFYWPAPPDEPVPATLMGEMIARHGLAGYLDALRTRVAAITPPHPIKIYDDATAVLVTLP